MIAAFAAAAALALRIVSLSPATTEDLFAIGAGPQVVAIDEYAKRPAAALRLPRAGGIYDLDLEGVLALEPSFVTYQAPDTPQTKSLAASGTPVVRVPGTSLADDLDGIRILGRATGRGRAADAYVARLQASMARSARRVARERRLRVLFVDYPQPIYSVGRGSFADDLLTRANLENVLADLPLPWDQVSPEIVAETRPDVVMLADGDGYAFELPPAVPWTLLDAVRGRRVVRLHENLDPGPYVDRLLDDMIASVAPYR